MVQKAQLLRKTLQAAAAARDGLHHSVGAGLELNLNPGWDFNNNVTLGANGQPPGISRGPLNLHANGLGPLANAQIPALNQYFQHHPLALPRNPIPPPIPPSFPRTLPLGTLPPKPTRLGTRVSTPLTPQLPPHPGAGAASQPPPAPTPAMQGIDAATAEAVLASLLGQPHFAAAAHAAPSTSAALLSPPPASAPEQPAGHALAEALGQHGLSATSQMADVADGLGPSSELQLPSSMPQQSQPLQFHHEQHQEHFQLQQQQQQQQGHHHMGEQAAPQPGSATSAAAASSVAAAAAAERHSRMLQSRQQKPSPLANSQPPQKHVRTRGSGMSVALNKSIMSASCVGELLALVRARGSSFDFFNISSAVSRAPKLVEAEHASAKAGHAPPHSTPSLTAAEHNSGSPTAAASSSSDHTGAACGEGHSDSSGAGAHCTGGSAGSPPLSGRARALADCLYNLSLQHLHTFDARGLANTAWAFAKMRYVPDSCLPAALSAQAAAHIDEFAAQNLSNLAWAMVYMHHRDPFLLGLMSERVLLLREQFKPQEVANIMWAFASLEHHDTNTLSGLCERVGQLGPRVFKEQELSNILWSLGRAHHQAGPLLDELLEETLHKLDHFQPQGISNIVWALGQLNHNSPALMSAISQRYSQPSALRAFDSQGLCNLAWGSAMLGHHDPPFMAALADEALRRAATCGLGPGTHAKEHQADAASCGNHAAGHGSSSLCLTTVLWATAALRDWPAASRLLQAVADEARSHPSSRTSSNGSSSASNNNSGAKSSGIHSWEPTSLAQAAWGCVRLLQVAREGGSAHAQEQQEREEVLDALAAAVAARVERFSGQPLVLALSAFGSSSAHEGLVEQLTKRVERAAPMMSEQQCKACLDALHTAHCPSSAAAADALHKRSAALAAAAAAAADARASAPALTHRSAHTTHAAPAGAGARQSTAQRAHAKGPHRGPSWRSVGGGNGSAAPAVSAAPNTAPPSSWDPPQPHVGLPLPVDGCNWEEALRAAGMGDVGAANAWLGGGAQWGEAAEAALRSGASHGNVQGTHPFLQGAAPPSSPLAVVQAAAAAAAAAATQAALRAGGGANVDAAQREHMREHVWASAWPQGLFEDVGELDGQRRCSREGKAEGQQATMWASPHDAPNNDFSSPSSASSGGSSDFVTSSGFPSSPDSDALIAALLSGQAACQSLPGSAALAGHDQLRARLQGLEGLGLGVLGLGGPGFGGMDGMVDGGAGASMGGFGMAGNMADNMQGGAWAGGMNSGIGGGQGGGISGLEGLGGAAFSAGFGAGSASDTAADFAAHSAGACGPGSGVVGGMDLSQWLSQMGSTQGYGQPEGAPAPSAGWSSHWFPQVLPASGPAMPPQGSQLTSSQLPPTSSGSGSVDSAMGLSSSSSGGGSGLLPHGLLEPAGEESAWGAGFHAGQKWALSAL